MQRLIDRCARIAVVVCGLALIGCQTSEAEKLLPATTSTTSIHSDVCALNEIVVDPHDELVSLEPGCQTVLKYQTFGRGGSFDVYASDNAGGGNAYDLVWAHDGDTFVTDYWAGAESPDPLVVTVELLPHSTCGDYSGGASERKEFHVPPPSHDCVVRFRIPDDVDVVSIAFTLDYRETATEVVGCDYAAVCTSRFTKFPFAYDKYDNDAAQELGVYVANAPGFSGPTHVAECKLRAITSTQDILAENFTVSEIEARGPTPLTVPIVPPPSVEVEVDCDAVTTTTTLPENPASCGQPCTADSSQPRARDALYTLNSAVGLGTCKTCICDVNRSGAVDSTDALTVLARAVGLDALVRCVQCATPLEAHCGE